MNIFIIYYNYVYNIYLFFCFSYTIYKEAIEVKSISIKRKGDDGYKVISVRIKENTLNKIDELSKDSNRSRNELINILLENCIDDVTIN